MAPAKFPDVTLSVRLSAIEIKHLLAICEAKDNVNDINQRLNDKRVGFDRDIDSDLTPIPTPTSTPTEKRRKTLDIVQIKTMKLNTLMN